MAFQSQTPRDRTRHTSAAASLRAMWVMDPSSNSTYAFFVSAISFDRLSHEVTKRWLSEPCPGRHLPTDDEDRTKIIAALRVAHSGRIEIEVTQRGRAPSRSDLASEPRREEVRRPKNRR
jgi:hypothetical protein